MPCVFCEIAKKNIAAEVVFENEEVFAFLDHNPIAPGHCLVIPRRHVQNIIDGEVEVLSEVIKAVKSVGDILMKRYSATGLNVLCANGKDAQQTVFHLHFHVIPRAESDGLNLWFGKAENKKVFEEVRDTFQ